jgi:hypothetical protein
MLLVRNDLQNTSHKVSEYAPTMYFNKMPGISAQNFNQSYSVSDVNIHNAQSTKTILCRAAYNNS